MTSNCDIIMLDWHMAVSMLGAASGETPQRSGISHEAPVHYVSGHGSAFNTPLNKSKGGGEKLISIPTL